MHASFQLTLSVLSSPLRNIEEEEKLMDDESFMDMLRSGDQEEEEECFAFFSPPSPLSNSLSCCFSACSAAEQMLSFDGAGKEEAPHQRSSDSSVSSSPSSTNHSKATKKKVASGSRSGGKKAAASASAGGAAKKSKTEASTGHGSAKGRKEKLGDRIMALQQLVSPFGKSDTASVLHEALGYIRFLHDQVQVLSSPYLQRLPSSDHLLHVDGGRSSDLRSRGLCLVPVACTEHVANINGADLWTPAMRNGNSKH